MYGILLISWSGQITRPVKYADELVLLAEEETLLQGMIDRVTEIGKEMDAESIW